MCHFSVFSLKYSFLLMCHFNLNSDYYSILLSRIYHAVSNTSQLLTAILFPVLIYLILKKSKTLGKYKHYMLIHAVLSFFFSSLIWLVKPTAMFKTYGLALCGPITDFGNREVSFAFFILLMSCWVNASISFSMSIIYRAFAVSLLGSKFLNLEHGFSHFQGNSKNSVITP